MINLIMKMLNHKTASASAKILWIRIYAVYGYTSFSKTYEELAEEFDSNRYTVRAQMKILSDINAVQIEAKTDIHGGNTFKLLQPSKWEN